MVVRDKWRTVSLLGLVLLFTLACESVSNLLNDVSVPDEAEFSEVGESEIHFSEDGPEELSSFCKSMLPMGIFTQAADAEGRFYLEGMQGFNGAMCNVFLNGVARGFGVNGGLSTIELRL